MKVSLFITCLSDLVYPGVGESMVGSYVSQQSDLSPILSQ